jgi:hypothetical protein
MGVKCKFEGCKTFAIYGIEKNKPLYCKKHIQNGEKDVLNKMCEKCNVKQATYGIQKKKPLWCKSCKEDTAFDVKHKMCENEDCMTRPTFGVIKAIRCLKHKKEEDIPFGYKYCEVKNCKLIPSFASSLDNVAIRCSKHKLDNWVDVSHHSAQCKYEGCSKQSSFGKENCIPEYCSEHKLKEHIDLKHSVCIVEGCGFQASFGFKNDKRMYCSLHKDNENHISLKRSSRNTDLQNALSICQISVKGKDKKRKRNYDLSLDFLFFLHHKQNGKCYYCENIMSLENNNNKTFDQISIDRKNSKIGHIMGNSVLTCLFCNSTKTDRPLEEYKLFLEFLRNPDKIHEFVVIPHKTWITTIFNNLKTKNTKTDITPEWIQQQFDKQDGKCFYTGIKMIITKENRYLFKPSMERMDCFNPYTRENCVLVCLGSNLGRNDLELKEYLKYIQNLRSAVNKNLDIT